MTPPARTQAAIELLDQAQSGLESSSSPRAPDELILVLGGRAGTRLDAGDGNGARREFDEVIFEKDHA